MATPEPVAPSRRLRTAAAAERERLTRDLGRLEERASLLQQELAEIDARQGELRAQLVLLARISSEAEDSPFSTTRTPDRVNHLQAVAPTEPDVKERLRGARIREVAVLMLASSPNPQRPIHYQQWYVLLREAGFAVDARDPVAAFLTQINRSPVVRRAGAPGVYALDFEAPARLRARLRELEIALAAGQGISDIETVDELVTDRQKRGKLLTALRAAERQLEEALRSLGDRET